MSVCIATFLSEDGLHAWELESDGQLLQRDKESIGSMWSPPETVANLKRRNVDEYDDGTRRSDYKALEERREISALDIPPLAVQGALAVFLLDPVLRPLIEAVDPKAVEQARKALHLI